MAMQNISTQDLKSYLTEGTGALLDIRPIAAYNGWALHDEPRGGHIRGASTFPLPWTGYDKWLNVMQAKGVTPDKPVVIYGYRRNDVETMAKRLRDCGYHDVREFNGFIDWSADPDLPMDRLSRYQHLVYPEWVRSVLAGEKPPTYHGNKVVVCHGGYDYREDYEAGHIPGAVYLDTLWLESPETWNRRSPEEIREALLKLGIRHDTTVILYGRFSYPNRKDERPGKNAGHLASIRCALILLYAGVEDVRVLNGGMAAWRQAGFEVTEEETKPEPVDDFGRDIPGHPEYIVDMPEAKDLLASNDGELVSVRSWEEFIGEDSGYNYIERTGRIPGAVFGNSGSDAYHMENYRNLDHTLREYHAVAADWAKAGVIPEKHIAFYCGTGWRASEAFLNAWLMGWPRVSVYDGGWFEWSSDPKNRIATGPLA